MSWRALMDIKREAQTQEQYPQKEQKGGRKGGFANIANIADGGLPLQNGITFAEIEAAYGHDPGWSKIKDDPRWLHHLAETLHAKKEGKRLFPFQAGETVTIQPLVELGREGFKDLSGEPSRVAIVKQ